MSATPTDHLNYSAPSQMKIARAVTDAVSALELQAFNNREMTATPRTTWHVTLRSEIGGARFKCWLQRSKIPNQSINQ